MQCLFAKTALAIYTCMCNKRIQVVFNNNVTLKLSISSVMGLMFFCAFKGQNKHNVLFRNHCVRTKALQTTGLKGYNHMKHAPHHKGILYDGGAFVASSKKIKYIGESNKKEIPVGIPDKLFKCFLLN